jgi:hypothetical protein
MAALANHQAAQLLQKRLRRQMQQKPPQRHSKNSLQLEVVGHRSKPALS